MSTLTILTVSRIIVDLLIWVEVNKRATKFFALSFAPSAVRDGHPIPAPRYATGNMYRKWNRRRHTLPNVSISPSGDSGTACWAIGLTTRCDRPWSVDAEQIESDLSVSYHWKLSHRLSLNCCRATRCFAVPSAAHALGRFTSDQNRLRQTLLN